MARHAVCIYRGRFAAPDLRLCHSVHFSRFPPFMCQHGFMIRDLHEADPNTSITPDVISAMFHALTSQSWCEPSRVELQWEHIALFWASCCYRLSCWPRGFDFGGIDPLHRGAIVNTPPLGKSTACGLVPTPVCPMARPL